MSATPEGTGDPELAVGSPKIEEEASCSRPNSVDSEIEEDEYFKPIKKLCMEQPRDHAHKPLTSFFIKDILSHTSSNRTRCALDRSIVRPWDLNNQEGHRRRPRSVDSRSEKSESDSPESPALNGNNSSPLDALFEMTSKAFEGLEANEKISGRFVTRSFEFVQQSSTTEEEKKIENSIYQSSDFRIRKEVPLSKVFITC